MRRWKLGLAILAAGAAVGATGAPTMAAWVDTAVNPTADVVSAPDWVAPAINSLTVRKSEGGVPGYIRQGGSYHVCAAVAADSGNPASGTLSVLADVSNLTLNLLNQVLGTLGGTTPCSGAENRDSGSLTALLVLGAGTKTISLTTKDNANNTSSQNANVVVDNTAPTAVEFETANKAGGTAAHPETGDTITFTYGEPVDPHSIVPGWDGTGTQTVFSYFVQSGNSDRLMIYRSTATGSVQVPLTSIGGYVSLNENYVDSSHYFTSTMVVSGNSFVITLGAPNVTGQTNTDAGTAATQWQTGNVAYDRAGNTIASTTKTEAAPADTEF